MKFGPALLMILTGIVIGIMGYISFKPTPAPVIVERPVLVEMSQSQLDSLHLAVELEVKGQLKPIVLYKKDTREVNRLLGEIISLRDSLKGKAQLLLTYENEKLPPYDDYLKVTADFVDSSMSVVFKPTKREFTVTVHDTIPGPVVESSGSPFWETVKDVAIFGVGVFVGRGTAK